MRQRNVVRRKQGKGQKGQQLGGAGFAGQRSARQRLPFRLPLRPGGGGHSPDIPFHGLPIRPVRLGHFRVDQLGDQQEPVRLFRSQPEGVCQMKKAGVICRDPQAIQQTVNFLICRLHGHPTLLVSEKSRPRKRWTMSSTSLSSRQLESTAAMPQTY